MRIIRKVRATFAVLIFVIYSYFYCLFLVCGPWLVFGWPGTFAFYLPVWEVRVVSRLFRLHFQKPFQSLIYQDGGFLNPGRYRQPPNPFTFSQAGPPVNLLDPIK